MAAKKIVLFCLALLLALPMIGQSKPSIELDWYGYFKLDAAYDQNQTSHGNFAMFVKDNMDEDEQFNMTHKQTRFGVKASSKGYENNVKLGGNIEFDMYGAGGAENKALLLLRHAYMTYQTGSFQLLAGQSWDLISPLNPSTLNYPVLWGCGNMGYRRPQVRLTYNYSPNENSNVRFAGGFFRTIGSDLTPTLTLATEVSDGSDDGTDSGMPSFQGIIDYSHSFSSGTKIRTGVSGIYGQLKAEGDLGSSETYNTTGVMGHLWVSFAQGWGFSGEFHSGSNLASYFGGINNANTFDGVNTFGAWAWAWLKASPKVTLGAGFGMDNPEDNDISAGAITNNTSYFFNVKYSPVKAFTMGIEASQWETEYQDADTYSSFRVQTSFILSF